MIRGLLSKNQSILCDTSKNFSILKYFSKSYIYKYGKMKFLQNVCILYDIV